MIWLQRRLMSHQSPLPCPPSLSYSCVSSNTSAVKPWCQPLPPPESSSAKSIWLAPYHWALSLNVTFSEKPSFYTPLKEPSLTHCYIVLYYLYIHLPITSLLLTTLWSLSIFVWHYICLRYFSNYYFISTSLGAQNKHKTLWFQTEISSPPLHTQPHTHFERGVLTVWIKADVPVSFSIVI